MPAENIADHRWLAQDILTDGPIQNIEYYLNLIGYAPAPGPGPIIDKAGAVANVVGYGADATGVADSRAAFLAANATGYPVYVPPGTFKISTALSTDLTKDPIFIGAGAYFTQLVPAAGDYFLDSSTLWKHLLVTGFNVSTTTAWAGFIRNTASGANNNFVQMEVSWNRLLGYSGACISTNSSNWPFWQIHHNAFQGANGTSTFAIALAGGMDDTAIENNNFYLDLAHIKLGQAGLETYILKNYFAQQASSGTGRAAIWIVPTTSASNGIGHVTAMNKFGNEGADLSDYSIIVCDQDATGTYFGDHLPILGTASTATVGGMTVINNQFNGIASRSTAMVFSTTPNLYGCRIGPNTIAGTYPTYQVELLAGLTVTANGQTNVIGPALTQSSSTSVPITNQSKLVGAYQSLPATITATQQATAYTLAFADANTIVESTDASAINITVPLNSTTAFLIGTIIGVSQYGAGQVTIVAAGGVTIDTPSSLTTRAQYSTVWLRKRGTNEWVISGDLT